MRKGGWLPKRPNIADDVIDFLEMYEKSWKRAYIPRDGPYCVRCSCITCICTLTLGVSEGWKPWIQHLTLGKQSTV
jgi:hypothetical protein